MEYDSQNRLVTKYQPYQASNLGNLSDPAVFPAWSTLVTNRPGNQPFEGKTYNPLGRILAEQDYAGNLTVYWYYAASDTDGRAGQLSYKRHYKNNSPAGQVPTWDFDDEHPTKGANPEIHYTYDTLGRTTDETVKAYNATGADGTLIEGPNTWTTQYDAEGHVASLSTPQGSIGYAYDSVTGLRQSTYTPATGSPVTKLDNGYDALGRLASVTVDKRNNIDINEQTLYGYNKAGSQEKVAYPNGNEAVYEYDALNRLSRLTNYKDGSHAESQLLSRFEYSCYANGQRATAVETRTGRLWTGSELVKEGHPTRSIAYQYDGLGRLKREQRNGNDPNLFTYDLVGNRVSQEVGNLVGSGDNVKTYYFYDSRDRLEKESLNANGTPAMITYGYDDNGSLTSQTQDGVQTTYGYDLRNRLISVTTPDGTTSYAYNPDGIRVRKQVGNGTPTAYLIDPYNPTGYSQVLQETTGSTVTTYTLGSDVIGQAVGSTVTYLLYDGHGSVRNHATGSGDLIWFDIPGEEYDGTDDPTDQDYTLYTYDAWGQECRRPTGDGLYYSGEQYDSALKMYNLRARYYNPANGRFNQTDSFDGMSEYPQSLHRYLYAHCDPINATDPSGMFTVMEISVANLYRSVMSNIDLSVYGGVELSAQTHLSGGSMEQAIAYMAISNIAPYLIGPATDMISHAVEKLFSAIRWLKPNRLMLQGNTLVGAAKELAVMHRQMGRGKDATEIMGIIGGGLTARQLGYLPTGFKPMYHGIDDIWRMGDEFLIIEYKGGTGTLSQTKVGQQMSQRWIHSRLQTGIQSNPDLIADVQKALAQGKVKGMVVTTPVQGTTKFIPTYEIKDYRNIGLNSW